MKIDLQEDTFYFEPTLIKGGKKKPKRKFKKGPLIDTMSYLAFHLERDSWIYLNDTPKHPSVMRSMTFQTLLNLMYGKRLWVAQRRENGSDQERP